MPTCTSCGHDSGGPARFCPECGVPFEDAAPAREVRKTVTVVFCDVTGSTELGEQLDPESLRRVMARYFETARGVIERHGGTVEKFIGDAVMAVFGIPVLHEDDALRAVRAAAELRGALTGLNEALARDYGVELELRIGVNTGEVVTGTEERLATGDAVTVAARLESAARPGEVLLGETTVALVRDAVDVGEPLVLDLKGKAEPVVAYGLMDVHAGVRGHSRHLSAPLVGRSRELGLLAGTWGRVKSEHGCHLFTLLGPPGVGKSRLVAEFLEGVDDALVLRAGCLSYGEGITYWPVIELLVQLLGDEPRAALVEFGVDEVAAATALGLLGLGDVTPSTEETAWGVRKVLETAAAAAPLVVVLDDVQWGEPAFLELAEHVADWSRDAPILLLCLARSDLLDRRPGWGGGKVNATTVLLEALSPAEADELIGNLVGDTPLDAALRRRILASSEGNPLFVEEMLAMFRDGDGADAVVPPTIQALLAARLDQLDPAERVVLERGSVEGQVFHRGAVEALAPEELQVGSRLLSLVRKELVRPDTAQLPGDDAFRFRHLLIRDAAYDALPKAVRADLHERFVDWLEQRGPGLAEADEIVGYHLEQTCRYRAELGPVGDQHRALAARAASHLAVAGRAAEERGDSNAAANLLGRALGLLLRDAPATDLRLDFAEALFETGQLVEAHETAVRAAELATTAADRPGELRSRLRALRILLQRDPIGTTDEMRRLLDEALPVFERLGDDKGLVEVWKATAAVAKIDGREDEATAASLRALECARRLGNRREEVRQLNSVAWGLWNGRTPVPEIEQWLDEQTWPAVAPTATLFRGLCLACAGRLDEARAVVGAARELQRESGWRLGVAASAMLAWDVENLAGDAAAAERLIRQACGELEELGERSYLSTASALYALSLAKLGRYDEAEAWARRGLEAGGTDDVFTVVTARRALARVALHRGDLGEAERLARDAVSLNDTTDDIRGRADALLDLAAVLAARGDGDAAAIQAERAAELYEAKGDLVSGPRARSRVAELRA